MQNQSSAWNDKTAKKTARLSGLEVTLVNGATWLGEQPGHCDPGEEETDTRMLLWQHCFYHDHQFFYHDYHCFYHDCHCFFSHDYHCFYHDHDNGDRGVNENLW